MFCEQRLDQSDIGAPIVAAIQTKSRPRRILTANSVGNVAGFAAALKIRVSQAREIEEALRIAPRAKLVKRDQFGCLFGIVWRSLNWRRSCGCCRPGSAAQKCTIGG